jgi:hypothetical protein
VRSDRSTTAASSQQPNILIAKLYPTRPVTPVYRPHLDACRDRLRSYIDAGTFAATKDAGRVTPLDQIVAKALSWAAEAAPKAG